MSIPKPDQPLQPVFISRLDSAEVFIQLPEKKPVEKKQENLQRVADDVFEQLPQTTKRSFWGYVAQGASKAVEGVQWGASKVAQGVQSVLAQKALDVLTIGAISESDKEVLIAQAKRKMRENLNDPHYEQLYEWMAAVLWPSIKPGLLSSPDLSPALHPAILGKEDFISDLLQIALAQGFANLAEEVAKTRKEDQSPLVSLLSFFIQKMDPAEGNGKKNYREALASIEKEYESSRYFVSFWARQYLPQFGFKERDLIKAYIQQTDRRKKNEIKNALIEGFKKKRAEWVIDSFFSECDRLSIRHTELQKVFEEMADHVFVKSLFPHGLSEAYQALQLPTQFRFVLGYFFPDSSFAKLIAGNLQDFYDPLVYNPSREFGEDIKRRLGQDVEQMIQAPSALALGLSKHYIEGEPKKVVDLIHSMLAAFLPTDVAHSQASWIAESLQEILGSKDKSFFSLGQFAQGIMRDLVLSITSQAVKSLIKDGETIDQTQLIKILTDRLVGKISSFDLQSKIPDSFWETLTVDLPIPAFLLPSIRDFIKAKVEEWRPTLFDAQTAFQEMKETGRAAAQKIQSYPGGKDLITLVEQMSDWLVQKMIRPEGGLITTQLGVNDEKIEELFHEYLPGIQISPEFKNWFKNNVGALANQGEQNSQSMALLKQGISSLCLVGIEAVVQRNGNAESFISSLLENIRKAFTEAVATFKATYSSDMPTILKFQGEIKNHQLRIEELVQRTKERKEKNDNYLQSIRLTDFEVRRQKRIKEALRAQKRYHKAIDSVEDLKESLQQLEIQRQQLYREIQTKGVVGVTREQLNTLKTAIANTKSALRMAEKELEIRRKEGELKVQAAFQEEALQAGQPGYIIWKDRMAEVLAHLTDLDNLHTLARASLKLEKQLEAYFPPFQTLATKLMGFVGLDKPDNLTLSPFLKDQIWPSIESFQKQSLASLLFNQSLPVFEINQNRSDLERISGSSFLGDLAQAISKDLFTLLPDHVGSAFTPEQVIEMMASYIPGFNEELKKPLIAEFQGFIEQGPAHYKQATEDLQPYVEGLLLKMFIRLAKKNPAQGPQNPGEQGKDTFIVVAEKLLQKTGEKYVVQQGGGVQNPQSFARDLSQAIMKEVLGIESPQFFEDLAPLQGFVYDFVKNQLESNLVDIQKGAETLETQSTAKRPMEIIAEKIADDLAGFIVDATVDTLGKKNGNGDLEIIETLSTTIQTQLEFAKGKLSVAKVLQDYQGASQLKQIFGKTAMPILDPQKFVQDRSKVAELLSNLLERLLNGTIGAIGQFEDEHKAKFNQSLMAHFLTAAAEHFKNIRGAKALAKQAGQTEIKHADFYQVAKSFDRTLEMIQQALAPFSLSEKGMSQARLALIGILQEEIKEDERILEKIAQAISQVHDEENAFLLDEEKLFKKLKAARTEEGSSLLEVIKEDALPNLREPSGYTPAVKAILDLLLPNGKQDLDFVPENQRSMVWGLLKTNLFPMILQMITGIILNPNMINRLVLNSLELFAKTRNAPITAPPKHAPAAPAPNMELNRAAGELLDQILPMVSLPQILKDQVLDSSGHVYPELTKTLGSILVGHLTDGFIQDNLKLALEMVISNQLFNYHAAPGATVKEEELKKVFRDVADAEISYQIRNYWVRAQAQLDQWIEDYFGKVGASVKWALDQVFHFVFFKIIGTILGVAFYPLKLLIKEAIYKVIDLDKNREALLGPLTKKPTDQPKADHVVYNEDLVYKLCKALDEALEKAKAPIVPVT